MAGSIKASARASAAQAKCVVFSNLKITEPDYEKDQHLYLFYDKLWTQT
jgi:hypothetical protein